MRLQLLAHALDVGIGPGLGVDAALDGGVLGGQAEGVEADREEDVVALHAHEARARRRWAPWRTSGRCAGRPRGRAAWSARTTWGAWGPCRWRTAPALPTPAASAARSPAGCSVTWSGPQWVSDSGLSSAGTGGCRANENVKRGAARPRGGSRPAFHVGEQPASLERRGLWKREQTPDRASGGGRGRDEDGDGRSGLHGEQYSMGVKTGNWTSKNAPKRPRRFAPE